MSFAAQLACAVSHRGGGGGRNTRPYPANHSQYAWTSSEADRGQPRCRTTGNTMAPCVIISERTAEVLRTEHKLQTSSLPLPTENHEDCPDEREEIVIGD